MKDRESWVSIWKYTAEEPHFVLGLDRSPLFRRPFTLPSANGEGLFGVHSSVVWSSRVWSDIVWSKIVVWSSLV